MRRIPRNDPEANALAYEAMEQPLRKVLHDYSRRNARGMMERITSILTSAGYDGRNGSTVLIRQADPSTIRTLEELALRLPDAQRQRMMSRMYGQIGAGSLTVRKAVQDVIRYGPFLDARKMQQEAQDVLRRTAMEGMFRGEFMVQKAVGVGWQMETPNIKQVDAFLKDKWSMREATAYLKPMSQVMRDQVTESIFLGESPQKMAKRMERVDEISRVRANRNARTITTAVANEAQMSSYKRDGIQRYRWVATFDERTCPECGAMDGREFELGKGQYPPLHPNCRCTTVAVLDKAAQDRVNAIIEAHKNDKGAKYVPPGMTYEEWASRNITPAKPRKPQPETPTKRQQTVTPWMRHLAARFSVITCPRACYNVRRTYELLHRIHIRRQQGRHQDDRRAGGRGGHGPDRPHRQGRVGAAHPAVLRPVIRQRHPQHRHGPARPRRHGPMLARKRPQDATTPRGRPCVPLNPLKPHHPLSMH